MEDYKNMILRAHCREKSLTKDPAPTSVVNANTSKVLEEKEKRLLRSHLLTLKARIQASHEGHSTLLPRSHNAVSNLSKAQLLALRQLRHDRSLIIKPADKNLGPVVMDRSWYENECMRQLSDSHFYDLVGSADNFSLSFVVTKLENVLASHSESRILSNYDRSCIFQSSTATTSSQLPNFYILPKLHKKPVVGRPIVASHSYVLTNVARWIDQQLQPVVAKLPHVLRDSCSMVSLLESTPITLPASVPSTHQIFMFTADITSLYTNIPHNDGLHGTALRLSLGGQDVTSQGITDGRPHVLRAAQQLFPLWQACLSPSSRYRHGISSCTMLRHHLRLLLGVAMAEDTSRSLAGVSPLLG